MGGQRKCDVVLAGVGGQGVLSIGALIAAAAHRSGLWVRQSEVHGMSQRGGAVQALLRMSDRPVRSGEIGRASADLVLATEPVEALRQLPFLAPGGTLVTAAEAVENVPGYPDLETLLSRVRALPAALVVEAERLAREAGSPRAANVVLVGAAADLLPIEPERLEEEVRRAFAAKGAEVVETNLRAFRAGREAARCVAS